MNKRVYLITGASSDLGIQLIQQLPRSKDDVIIAHYHSNKEQLEQLSAKLDLPIHCLQGDFSSRNNISKFVEQLENLNLIPTDIIHFPSRLPKLCRFKDMDISNFEIDFNVQVVSIAQILKKLLPKMSKQHEGRIVFVLTSYIINKPPKFLSSYVTSKYALLGLLKSLVSEYAEKNIRINAVSPSMIETKFLAETDPKIIEMSAYQNPMKRNAAIADIIPAILFLLDEKSNYINGANIPITGGSEF